MDIAFEQKIRQRAYEIWMAAGMIDGAADEHWLLAKTDVCDESKPAKSPSLKAVKPKSAAKVEKAAKPASKPTAKVARKPAAVEAHAGA